MVKPYQILLDKSFIHDYSYFNQEELIVFYHNIWFRSVVQKSLTVTCIYSRVSLLLKSGNYSEFQTHLSPLPHMRDCGPLFSSWAHFFKITTFTHCFHLSLISIHHWAHSRLLLGCILPRQCIISMLTNPMAFAIFVLTHTIWLSWSFPASWDILLSLGFQGLPSLPSSYYCGPRYSPLNIFLLYISSEGWNSHIILSIYYHCTFFWNMRDPSPLMVCQIMTPRCIYSNSMILFLKHKQSAQHVVIVFPWRLYKYSQVLSFKFHSTCLWVLPWQSES